MRQDPLWSQTDDVITHFAEISRTFADCSVNTRFNQGERRTHVPDYRTCDRLADRGGSCSVFHDYTILSLVTTWGGATLQSCGSGCTQVVYRHADTPHELMGKHYPPYAAPQTFGYRVSDSSRISAASVSVAAAEPRRCGSRSISTPSSIRLRSMGIPTRIRARDVRLRESPRPYHGLDGQPEGRRLLHHRQRLHLSHHGSTGVVAGVARLHRDRHPVACAAGAGPRVVGQPPVRRHGQRPGGEWGLLPGQHHLPWCPGARRQRLLHRCRRARVPGIFCRRPSPARVRSAPRSMSPPTARASTAGRWRAGPTPRATSNARSTRATAPPIARRWNRIHSAASSSPSASTGRRTPTATAISMRRLGLRDPPVHSGARRRLSTMDCAGPVRCLGTECVSFPGEQSADFAKAVAACRPRRWRPPTCSATPVGTVWSSPANRGSANGRWAASSIAATRRAMPLRRLSDPGVRHHEARQRRHGPRQRQRRARRLGDPARSHRRDL